MRGAVHLVGAVATRQRGCSAGALRPGDGERWRILRQELDSRPKAGCSKDKPRIRSTVSGVVRGGHGMALVNRREVLEPRQAVGLEAPLVRGELRAGHASASKGFTDIA